MVATRFGPHIKPSSSSLIKCVSGHWTGLIWIHIFFLILVFEAIGTAATPGLLYQPREIVKMIVEKQMECRLAGKPKFSEKPCPSATSVHHKIPHDQTRVWTRAAAVGSRRLTAWAMARPYGSILVLFITIFGYYKFSGPKKRGVVTVHSNGMQKFQTRSLRFHPNHSRSSCS
jgi:hypothetical protein